LFPDMQDMADSLHSQKPLTLSSSMRSDDPLSPIHIQIQSLHCHKKPVIGNP
jgi:hypothetical protein